MSARPEQIRSIQALRAVAACAVVMHHAVDRASIDLGLHSEIATSLAYLGNAGVDLFFLISGFLMTHLHREQFGRGASFAFLRRRFERIAPLYWLLGAAALSLALLAPRLFASERSMSLPWLLGNFLFFPWPQPSGTMEHIMIVGWTLDYEMYFYVVFALAMVFRRGLPLLALWMLASYAIGEVFHPHHPWLRLLSSGMLLEFLAGAAIAVLYGALPASSRTKALGWALLAFGAALFAASPWITEPRYFRWGSALAVVFFGTLWAGFECRGRIGRTLVTLGDASYSVYLFQVFALPAIGLVLKHSIERYLPMPAAIAIYCVGGCAAGVACWYAIERPIGRWIKRRTRHSLAPVLATADAITK